MSAAQAARHLGRSRDAAWRWQKRSGHRWPPADLGIPAVVRGRRYPSLTAAAKAHGVTIQTAIGHLNDHGNLDRLGIGKSGNGRSGGRKAPMVIAGRHYPSRKAAAQALRTTPEYLARLIRLGRADLIAARALRLFGKSDADAYAARAKAEGRVDKLLAKRRSDGA